jgi:hypothetical protein
LREEELIVFSAKTGHHYGEDVCGCCWPDDLEVEDDQHLISFGQYFERCTFAPNLSKRGPPTRLPPKRKNV